MLIRLMALGACLVLVAACHHQVNCKALDEHHQEESGAEQGDEHHSTETETGTDHQEQGDTTNPQQGDGEENDSAQGEENDSKAAEANVDPVKYLGDFGYIDKDKVGDWNSLAEDVFENAIREFQRFVNITETGKVDALTKEYMAKNRCGNKDIDQAEAINGRNGTYEDPLDMGDDLDQQDDAAVAQADENGEQLQPGELKASNSTKLQRVKRYIRRHKRYALMGTKWPRMTVTYRTTKYTSHKRVKREDWDKTVAKAFEAWASVAPLKFEKRDTGKVDIEMSFVKGEHPGCENELKEKSTVLAHAYQPGKNPINGDIHFNDYHKWTTSLKKDAGLTPVLPVAIHEIGHSLGVDHSHIKKAIMFPMNQGHLTLDTDDKRAINELYGDKKKKTGGTTAKGGKPTTKPKSGPSTTRKPGNDGGKPRSPQRPASTTKPRTGPSGKPKVTQRPSAPRGGAPRPPTGGVGGTTCLGGGTVCPGGGGVIVGGGNGVVLVPEPNDGVGNGPGIHVGVDNRMIACGGAFFARGPNCRQFFDCTAPVRRLKFCPPGLFWRQSRLWCDFPHNVPECDYEVDPVADAPEHIYPGQPPLVGVGTGGCVGVRCGTIGGGGGVVTTNENNGGEPDASTDDGTQGDTNHGDNGNDNQGGENQDPNQGDSNSDQSEPNQGDSSQGDTQAGPQGDDGTHGENHDSDAAGGQDSQSDGGEQAAGELNSGPKKVAKKRQ